MTPDSPNPGSCPICALFGALSGVVVTALVAIILIALSGCASPDQRLVNDLVWSMEAERAQQRGKLIRMHLPRWSAEI